MTANQRTKNSSLKIILIAGLVAGTLDGLAAGIKFYIDQDRGPGPVFRYIASAALDKNDFSRDGMLVFGILFHYLIAILFAAFFLFLYRAIPLVRKNIFVTGLLYGLFVWVMMNQVVLPLSRLAPIPFNLKGAVIAALILIFMVGVPIALITKKLSAVKQ
jgi:hypothetical protein